MSTTFKIVFIFKPASAVGNYTLCPNDDDDDAAADVL